MRTSKKIEHDAEIHLWAMVRDCDPSRPGDLARKAYDLGRKTERDIGVSITQKMLLEDPDAP